MFTDTKTLRGVATRDVRQANPFSGETPGLRLSESTDGMPRQPFTDPAGTVLPVPAWFEGSIR